MRRWRTSAALAATAGLLALALPAIGQNAPELLLPPGFDEPEAAPASDTAETPPNETGAETPAEPRTRAEAATRRAPRAARTGELEGLLEGVTDEALIDPALLEPPPPPIEIPEESRRPVDIVGPLTPGDWGLGANAFGAGNGRFLSGLMRRTEAPIASRWLSILLRNALLSRVQAPAGVQPVDWVAERAWLLLRMGEADAARMLVQSIDVDRFTPKMFEVAGQVGLATADPAALCPLYEGARATSKDPIWVLAEAMCAGLSGEAGRAASIIDTARRRRRGERIDLLLAEKVAGAGAGGRKAITIQWDDVESLTAWRFGLASATAVSIPETLFASAGPQVRAWAARAPLVPLDQRLGHVLDAASLGVVSSSALVDVFSALGDADDPFANDDSDAGRLRRAYRARTVAARMEALRAIWGSSEQPGRRHALRLVTARAASLISPRPALAEDAPDLVEAMLAAGLDAQAARWLPLVRGTRGERTDRAWTMLAVGAPGEVAIDTARIDALAGGDEAAKRRAGLLVAALAGLGRIDQATANGYSSDLGLALGRVNPWNMRLMGAAAGMEGGTVALLSAVGMQTRRWEDVPPRHLYRIVRALRRAGLEYHARMVAAEAMARL